MDTEEESERGEGEVDPPGRSPKGIVHVEGDLTPLTIGKRGLVWIFPWICVPVFAGSLWRLTALKNVSHLDGGVLEKPVWQRRWRRLAAKSTS